MGVGVAVAEGEAVGVGVAVALGVGVGEGSGVGVAVAEGEAVAVGVAVALGVGVTVGVAVGVGLGDGGGLVASNESTRVSPRWKPPTYTAKPSGAMVISRAAVCAPGSVKTHFCSPLLAESAHTSIPSELLPTATNTSELFMVTTGNDAPSKLVALAFPA